MQLDHTESSGRLKAPTIELPGELASIRLKGILMQRLREMRQSRGLTQVEAAVWFGVSQPRISHLAQNRVNRFTVDTLINMLAHAGVGLSLTYQPHPNEERSSEQRRRS